MEFDQSTSEVFFVWDKKIVGPDFEIQPLKVERKSKNDEKCSISRLWRPVKTKRLQFFSSKSLKVRKNEFYRNLPTVFNIIRIPWR